MPSAKNFKKNLIKPPFKKRQAAKKKKFNQNNFLEKSCIKTTFFKKRLNKNINFGKKRRGCDSGSNPGQGVKRFTV